MVAWRRTAFRGLRSTPAVPSLGNGPEGNVRENRNRPQGRYQLSRGDPSGSLFFAVGTDVPSAGQPLSSATLGGAWKVTCVGDGRNKSGLGLHLALISIQQRPLQANPSPPPRSLAP